MRNLYLAILEGKITASVLKDKFLAYGLTAVQIGQIFDILFAISGATKTNWLLSLLQIYSRLFITFGTLPKIPNVFLVVLLKTKV